MWVHAVRGSETESLHRVVGLVVGLEPHEEVRFGESETMAYWRSAMKPFQALPVVAEGAADAFGLDAADLALCCGSHGGTPEHVARAEAILDRLGLEASALACGPHPPFDEPAARALVRDGKEPGRVHNNCSGKHAGMLSLALHRGWSAEGYARPEHPVQGRIREELDVWLDVASSGLSWATDGCGVPTPFLSVRQMARAYARLGRVAAEEPGGAAARVVAAMTQHPNVVGHERSLATALIGATGGRVLGKEGAEGVFCATAVGGGWGVALKVLDGGARAMAPALIEMLASVGLLREEELERLADRRRPVLRNSREEPVGELRAEAWPRRAAVAARL